MPFVLDASVALAWLFDDEATPYADVVLDRLILPAAEMLQLLSHRLRVIQRGQMRNYVFYIFAAVVALLMWTLPVGRVFVRFLSR